MSCRPPGLAPPSLPGRCRRGSLISRYFARPGCDKRIHATCCATTHTPPSPIPVIIVAVVVVLASCLLLSPGYSVKTDGCPRTRTARRTSRDDEGAARARGASRQEDNNRSLLTARGVISRVQDDSFEFSRARALARINHGDRNRVP